ncbi:hypothetical protein [Alicyclobacillus fodiniaquatilis]|uniref:Uncharacterized protein n=1 Tax=Alicyclobacillus fodiniaquatilis TaxID=1661150 RepID=A0ABW4JI29_9BACL
MSSKTTILLLGYETTVDLEKKHSQFLPALDKLGLERKVLERDLVHVVPEELMANANSLVQRLNHTFDTKVNCDFRNIDASSLQPDYTKFVGEASLVVEGDQEPTSVQIWVNKTGDLELRGIGSVYFDMLNEEISFTRCDVNS